MIYIRQFRIFPPALDWHRYSIAGHWNQKVIKLKKTNTFYIVLFLFHAVFYFTAFYLRLFTFSGYSRDYLLSCTFFILEIIFTSVSFGLLLLFLILYDFGSLSVIVSGWTWRGHKKLCYFFSNLSFLCPLWFSNIFYISL